MKKILVLGGAKAQVPLIQAAKKEGYYVVLCDWTTTNPGIPYADKHYQVSTLDLSAVMEVAKKEQVDGVISNSEAAMANVAAISSELGLVGNSVQSVELLQSKYGFRALQKQIGVFAPEAFETDCASDFLQEIEKMHFPVVVKPSKSSGSRGTTRFDAFDREAILQAFQECAEFSTNNKVTGEEYIKMPTLTLIEAEAFIHHGEILWDGLFSTIRQKNMPFIPQIDCFPSLLNQGEKELLEKQIFRILHAADFRFGEINIEGYFTEDGELFTIEINVRQGGGDNPTLVHDHCGIDMYKLLVTTCCGDDYYFENVLNADHDENYVTNLIVFPMRHGIINRIHISPEIMPYVYKVTPSVSHGQQVREAMDATDAVGMVRMRFPDRKTQLEFLPRLNNLIFAEVEA